MSFIAGLRNLSNTTPAIDSFRQASLNPAITQSFVRPSEARQATKVTEPITFTNILEEEEEPFVDVTGDLEVKFLFLVHLQNGQPLKL